MGERALRMSFLGRRAEITTPEIVGLVMVLLVGSCLRLFRLTFQSLWFDELFSVIFSSSGRTVAEIAEKYAGDVHPLGYPVMLHWWLGFFGDNDFAARSLSAAWGIAGIVAMWWVARSLGGRALGLVAAALTAVNAYHIAYSQEARSYATVFVFAVLSYGLLLLLVKRPTWQRGLAYGVVVAAAVQFHYWALVMLFGQVVAAAGALLLRRAGRREWVSLMAACAVVAVSLLPWIGPFLRVAGMNEYWPAIPGPAFFITYFHIYFGRSLGLSVLCGGLLLALPWLATSRRSTEESLGGPSAALLAGSVAVSLVVAYARSVASVPMLVPRFTFVLLPAVLLLISLAVVRLRPKWIRTVVAALLVAASLANLVTTGYYTKVSKEQWREATMRVLRDDRFDPEVDVVLAKFAPGFQYYVDQELPDLVVEEALIDALRGHLEDGGPTPVLWLLLARRAVPSEEFLTLGRQHLRRTDTWRFRAMRVERWEPK